MKAFRFRLETLLRLKDASRERALQDYAISIKIRQEWEAKLDRAVGYIAELENMLSEKQKLNFRASDLASIQMHLEQARQEVESFTLEVSRKKALEESRRTIFLKKESESKSLLRLKERQMSEHLEMETKKEEHELEDVIGARYLYDRANPVL